MASAIVTVNISADVPSPRCVKVTGDQRLQVFNSTDAPVQVQLAQFDVQFQPEQAELFDAALGSYLAPGVHWLQVTGGNAPEIWLAPWWPSKVNAVRGGWTTEPPTCFLPPTFCRRKGHI